MNSVFFSSKANDWETPPHLFRSLDQVYTFTLDPCATPENAKCPTYFTAEDNGLSKPWSGRVFMNPPYGYSIGKWIKKAYEEVMSGRCDVVVALLPAKTETAWFHDHCVKGQITFLRLRVRFSGSPANAPFPSMIVVFTRPFLARPSKADQINQLFPNA